VDFVSDPISRVVRPSFGGHSFDSRNGKSVRGPIPELYVTTRSNQVADGDEPFVFLHGLGGTQAYWTAADGSSMLPRQSTLVDLFGFGRSPRPFRRYTLDSHLAALESALAGQPPSILVGHSLGAALAVAYAARNPESVTGLVLISLPSYGGPRGAVLWHRRRLRGWFLTNMLLTGLACITSRRLLRPFLPRLLPDIPREVAQDLTEHNVMSSITSLWNVLYRRDAAADIGALAPTIPVTFIHGVDDATAPIEPIRHLVSEHPAFELNEMKGIGHHPWLGDRTACSEIIASQVGKTSAGMVLPEADPAEL
jgi:pimeloyl-ACP methyl ester carboxylesterase